MKDYERANNQLVRVSDNAATVVAVGMPVTAGATVGGVAIGTLGAGAGAAAGMLIAGPPGAAVGYLIGLCIGGAGGALGGGYGGYRVGKQLNRWMRG